MAAKKRYYVFGGDLYLSRDGKDKNLGKATASQKKKYGGIVADTVTDIVEIVSGKPEKKQKKTPVRKTKSKKKEPSIINKIGQYFVDQKDKRTKTLTGKDYRKGGMVLKTTNNKRNT